MKVLWSALLIFVALFIQTTRFDYFSFYGIKPDLVLIIVVYFALFFGAMPAILVGVAAGLCQDILSGGILGLNMLTKTLVGYFCAYLGRQLVVTNPFNQMFMVCLGSLLEGGLTLFILKISPLNPQGTSALFDLILPQTLYNTLICGIVIYFLEKQRKRWSKKKRPWPTLR